MPDSQPTGFNKWWRRTRMGFWRNWIDFVEALWRSIVAPFGQPAFIFYFLGIIIVVGGLGVSIEVFEGIMAGTLTTSTAVPRSLSTYLLAILSTAFVDLNLNLEPREKRSLKMFVLFTLVLGASGGTIALRTSNIRWAYSLALMSTFFAILLWWMANSENAKLIEPNPPTTASLGEDVQEIPGTLAGIKI